MKRFTIWFAAAVALAVPNLGLAQNRGEFTLGWDNCRVSGDGTGAASFACNTNTGLGPLLVAGFIPAANANLTSMSGADIQLRIETQAMFLPAWWQMTTSTLSGCRPLGTSLRIDASNQAGAECDLPFYWPGSQFVISSYVWPTQYCGNMADLRVAVTADEVLAPQTDQPDAGEETFMFSVRVTRNATVGPGACAGCDVSACIYVYQGTIYQANGDSFVVQGEYSWPQPNNSVTWQHFAACNRDPDNYGCPPPVAARNSAWGSIKSIYR